jgi:hypothetical protein
MIRPRPIHLTPETNTTWSANLATFTFPVAPERVKAKDIAVDVTKGILTLTGKCGKKYSISLKGWKKLKEAVDVEIGKKAENGTQT